MKIVKICCPILCILLLTGCFNYKDMNRLFFATSSIIDVDESGDLVIYIEAFKAFRGGAEQAASEIKVIFKGKGKTIYDAYINATLSASNEINISQIKALIFTERAALLGLDKFIDLFERDQKPTVRMFLFVLAQHQDPESFISTNVEEEHFLGLFLENLMIAEGRLGRVHRMRLNDYFNERLLGSQVSAIPIIQKSQPEPFRIKLDGAGVFQKDKMVSKLTSDELVAYNFVVHGGNFGVMLADDPNTKSGLVSLKILRSRTKLNVEYDGKLVTLNKHINVTASLIEAKNKGFILDNNVRKQIEKSSSSKLTYDCIRVFQKFKKQGIDIYNIERMMEVKYPSVHIKNLLDNTQLGITDIKVHIEGSNNIRDFN